MHPIQHFPSSHHITNIPVIIYVLPSSTRAFSLYQLHAPLVIVIIPN